MLHGKYETVVRKGQPLAVATPRFGWLREFYAAANWDIEACRAAKTAAIALATVFFLINNDRYDESS